MASCDVSLIGNLSVSCIEDHLYCDHHQQDFPPNVVCKCYPFKHDLSIFVGVLCLVNAITGFCGNLLTLLAIPYAKSRGRFGFRKDWDATTLFVLNLAFSDLLYCSINLPMYALQFLSQSWPLGHDACVGFASFRYVNAFADWMSLGFIAFSRCMGVIRPELADKYLAGKSGVAVIVGIWAYAFGLVSLVVFKAIGEFGYNCRIGKCDFIKFAEVRYSPHQLLYGIGFSLPCAMIFISYTVIWLHVRSSTKLLNRNGAADDTQDQLRSRDLRMTWTLLLICFCYLVFVMPIAILNIADPSANEQKIHLLFFCIYWLQYSLNFVVYALRSEQYRKAYADFLKRAWRLLRRCICCDRASRPTHIFINSRRIFVNMREFEHDENEGLAIDSSNVRTISLTVDTSADSSDKASRKFVSKVTSKPTSDLSTPATSRRIKEEQQRRRNPSIVILAKRAKNIFLEINRESRNEHSFSSSPDIEEEEERLKLPSKRHSI